MLPFIITRILLSWLGYRCLKSGYEETLTAIFWRTDIMKYCWIVHYFKVLKKQTFYPCVEKKNEIENKIKMSYICHRRRNGCNWNDNWVIIPFSLILSLKKSKDKCEVYILSSHINDITVRGIR